MGDFTSGFETPSNWTTVDNASIVTNDPRSGTYHLELGNDENGYASYDNATAKYGTADFYYSVRNDSYFNNHMVIREQSSGGKAVAVGLDITNGSGVVRISEADSNGNWTTLTSNSISEGGFGTYTYISVTIALKEGSSNDCFGEVTINGSTYTTSEVNPSVTSEGNIGFGHVDLSNTGGDNRWDDITFTDLGVSAPSEPRNVSLAYNSDDQLTLTWDEVNDWGGEVGSYDIEISRDGASYVSPASGAGPSSVSGGSSSYSETYGPDSDNSYDSVVGIDSSFKFRVRATNSGGNSSWVESNVIYTSPLSAKDPSISRPDGETIQINYTVNTGIHDYLSVEMREDTGSGYGGWTHLQNIFGSGAGPVISGDPASEGSNVTLEFVTGTAYQSDTLQNDARYQFRLNEVRRDNPSGTLTSHDVYADYGNDGNVYFEDGFESGDLSAWDSDNGASVVSGSSPGFTAISGADEGTYYAHADGLNGDDAEYIQKNLGDLSSEVDVLVKCAFAVDSLDDGAENFGVRWYDGTSWNDLEMFEWEYNRQGWAEVSTLVPSSWLATDNRIRVMDTSASGMFGGDHAAVDRVVVSDLLHEYTKPSTPTNLELDPTTETEITATWNDNASFEDKYLRRIRDTGDSSWDDFSQVTGENGTTYTETGLASGVSKDIQVYARVIQDRNGSQGPSNYHQAFSNIASTKTKVTLGDNISVVAGAISADLSWTDVSSGEDGYIVQYEVDDERGYEFTGLGVDEKIEADESPIQPQQFSVEIIVEIDSLDVDTNNNYRQLITSSTGGNFVLVEQSGSVSFRVPGVDESNFTAGNIPADGTKHKITCVYDQSDRIIYVDGVEQNRETIGSGTVDLGSLTIGGTSTSHNPDGRIFGINLVDTALTTEITSTVDEFDGTDPILYYPLDEQWSSKTPDMSGYGGFGTVTGTSLTATNRRFTMDGSSDEITLPNLGFSGDTSITITARVSIDSGAANNNNVFGFGNAGNTNETCSIRTNGDGGWTFYFWGNNLNATTSNYYGQGEVWVAARYDASTDSRDIWFEGSQASSDSPSDPNFQDNSYSIGGFNGENLDGDVHDVQVYNRALTDEELVGAYNKSHDTTGLVGFWPLDVNNSGTTPDVSGNGNDGTVSGATLNGDGFITDSILSPNTESVTISDLTDNTTYEAKFHVFGGEFAGEFR